MNQSAPSLDLNLSYRHHRDGQKPLHVVLRATPLAGLIDDAKRAYRVYELFAIRRPGDIWKYIHVHPVSVAPDVVPRLANARGRAIERMRNGFLNDQLGSHSFDRDNSWLGEAIPFPEFDCTFFRAWDDTEPPDECWRSAAEGDAVRSFCIDCFDRVKKSQQRLRNTEDPLIEHEIAMLDSTEHVYDWNAVVPCLPTPPEYAPDTAPHFSETYYSNLAELLARPDVGAVSYVGLPDYHTLRLIFTEQRRRQSAGTTSLTEPMQVCVCASSDYDCSAWGGKARWYSEGIGYGDLCIRDERPNGGTDLGQSGKNRKIGQWLVSPHDHGEIDGFTRDSQDGYCLYSRMADRE